MRLSSIGAGRKEMDRCFAPRDPFRIIEEETVGNNQIEARNNNSGLMEKLINPENEHTPLTNLRSYLIAFFILLNSRNTASLRPCSRLLDKLSPQLFANSYIKTVKISRKKSTVNRRPQKMVKMIVCKHCYFWIYFHYC